MCEVRMEKGAGGLLHQMFFAAHRALPSHLQSLRFRVVRSGDVMSLFERINHMLMSRVVKRKDLGSCDDIADERDPFQAPCEQDGFEIGYIYCWGLMGGPFPHRRCWRTRPFHALWPFHSSHKIFRVWCKVHYLEHMHGLYTFQCTNECRVEQKEKSDVILQDEDLHTYVSSDQMFACVLNAEDMTCSSFSIRCAYCGRDLR